MRRSSRREFIKVSALAAVPARALVKPGMARSSPNETVNVAVMGIRGQGAFHLKNYPKVPNVNVAAVCDIDERLFPKAVAGVEAASGRRPKTYTDIRRLLEDKDIDAISIAAPNHWHALATDLGLPGRQGCLRGEAGLLHASKKAAGWCRLPPSTSASFKWAPTIAADRSCARRWSISTRASSERST